MSQPQTDTLPALNTVQAAAKLGLSPATLEKYRTIGGGPTFHKLGRAVRYTAANLETWSRARACESTSDPAYENLRRSAS